ESRCECGYLMEDTGDFWTHSIINNFSKYPNSAAGEPTVKAISKDWRVSTWENGAPRGRSYKKDNIRIEDGLLKLKQSAYSDADRTAGAKIIGAEIFTNNEDVLFGSIRSEYRVVVEPETDG